MKPTIAAAALAVLALAACDRPSGSPPEQASGPAVGEQTDNPPTAPADRYDSQYGQGARDSQNGQDQPNNGRPDGAAPGPYGPDNGPPSDSMRRDGGGDSRQ